jgi:hypothetical protein
MADLSVINGPDLAIGADAVLLERLNGGGDQWGQWRLRGLAGITQMPQPHQCFVGYEVFAALGMGRVLHGHKPRVAATAGLDAGLPLRLSRHKPIWRSDDLIGVDVYLVPSANASWFAIKQFEIAGSLSLRFGFWSAVLP